MIKPDGYIPPNMITLEVPTDVAHLFTVIENWYWTLGVEANQPGYGTSHDMRIYRHSEGLKYKIEAGQQRLGLSINGELIGQPNTFFRTLLKIDALELTPQLSLLWLRPKVGFDDLAVGLASYVRQVFETLPAKLNIGDEKEQAQPTQRFVFDEDSATVCRYILASDDLASSRTVKMTDDNWACECYLSAGAGHGVLYFVNVSMNLSTGRELAWIDDSAIWLVHNKEVADILITQDRAGECRAELSIEADPYGWSNSDALLPMSVGLQFVGRLWRDLIEGWTARKSTDTPSPAEMSIGDKAYIGGDIVRRDKIESAGGHIIHAEPGSTVIVVNGQPVNMPPPASVEQEAQSLQQQLNEARENLRLVQERKVQYVQEVDIPLQLIKDEEHWKKRIAELEAALRSK